MNIWGKIGLTALILMGSSKLFAASKALEVGMNMNVNILNPRIHKIDPDPISGGIEIRLEIELQNPTTSSMNMTQPYVQLLSNDSVISSTPVSKKIFLIDTKSQIILDTISLKLKWTDIFSQLSSARNSIPNNWNFIQKMSWIGSNYKQLISQMNLAVKYSTHANGIFYSDTIKINL